MLTRERREGLGEGVLQLLHLGAGDGEAQAIGAGLGAARDDDGKTSRGADVEVDQAADREARLGLDAGAAERDVGQGDGMVATGEEDLARQVGLDPLVLALSPGTA